MTDPHRCPACDRELVRIEVPDDAREYAPEAAAVVGSCPRCLRMVAVDDADGAVADDSIAGAKPPADPEPPDAIPPGEGGAALLLAIGYLDSVALNRPAIQALVEHAEASGADVFLALDRLAADESVDAHVDLARRRRQLESMLE
ncbi:hypothetical protein GCM10008995_28710 [Halobellus salinus]|uniref:Uncharacterized protein n=1 Tax=Halobellus salinus TaxID=931585 RepID=A0A830EWE6_9EURY|nr:DUF6276 family protein [Halobellus salinus]GGJ17087.1 hypothetical protein GCM10008995_28710 [Halobellus salinus]SMP34836.1 hypothetical protein SAMN06265347_1286 [Halobellus salinus]